jgi:hypothetical protein
MNSFKGFKFGSPRGILLVLTFGAGVSLVLLCAAIVLTGRQKRYSEAINNAGRLRYKTQRWGLVGLTETLLEKEPQRASMSQAVSSEEAFQDVQSMCAALLAEEGPASDDDAEPLLDSSIRDELESWRNRLQDLNKARPVASAPVVDLLIHNEEIEELVQDMDVIVDMLSSRAQDWIEFILVLQLCRVAWQGLFYFMLTLVFKSIWTPFVNTFNDLQKIQKQQDALLRADFDAVVEVDTSHPFTVKQSCPAFDDLAGRPMLGESLLGAASDKNAETDLALFLSKFEDDESDNLDNSSHSSKQLLERIWQWVHQCSVPWPVLRTDRSDRTAIAPKINSRLKCDVEIVMVRKTQLPTQLASDKVALIALRQLGPITREMACANDPEIPVNAPMDFHQWSKALDVVREDDDCISGWNATLPDQVAEEKQELKLDKVPAAGSSLALRAPKPDANGEAEPRPLESLQRQKRAQRSSSSRSSGSSSLTGSVVKREIVSLLGMQFTLTLRDELSIQQYSLNFREDAKVMYRPPSLAGCLIGEGTADFTDWIQESMNSLLYDPDLLYMEYPHEVFFRPPTAACVHPKLVLAAKIARIVWLSEDASDNGGWVLQLEGVSHVRTRLLQSGGPGGSLAKARESHFEL